jgi:hypothetical protein
MRVGRTVAGIIIIIISCIATTVQLKASDIDSTGNINKIEVKFPEYAKKPFYEMIFQKVYPIVYKEESIVYVQAALGGGKDGTKKIIELEKALNNFGWRKSALSKSSLKDLTKDQKNKNDVYSLKIYQLAEKINGTFLPLKKGLIWSYRLQQEVSTEGVVTTHGGIALNIAVIIEQLNQEALNKENKNKVAAEAVMNSKPSKRDEIIETVKNLIK